MILEIFTNEERSLNTLKIYVPLTDSINFDVTVVEYSAPEGTVYMAGENLGEHTSFLSFVEHASLLDYEAVIELNVLRSQNNNVYDNHDERNDKPECKNSPKLERGENALSCNDVRSVNIHLMSPSAQKCATDIF